MLRPTLLTLSLLFVTQAQASDLRTTAEKTSFNETGRYAEVDNLCKTFQQSYPKQVRCFEFGRTPQGRPMLAMAVNRDGVLTPQTAQHKGLPVTLFQGGIHAGEIDGKDAGFLALRELLQDDTHKALLEKQVMLFVPVFNIDGHERFGRWNRPNQRGPKAMGWRTTAQNFNLNRDYLKVDTPEMQAMLDLIEQWDPLATIDLHVTDGAQFQHDISIEVEPSHAGDTELQKAGAALRDNVIIDLAKQGSLPLPFYMSFIEEDNPASGFADNVPPPRFSHGYFLLRNRFGMLVEAHSWKDYPTRVRITRNTIFAVLEQVAEHGNAWRKIAQEADRRAGDLHGEQVALKYEASEKTRPIDFHGYAYTRTPSNISGALMTRYDENKPEIWHLTLRDDIQPTTSVRAPLAGYIVPPQYAALVASRLKAHGVTWQTVTQSASGFAMEHFHADSVAFEPKSLESHQRLNVSGEWQKTAKDISAGSLFVPIAQPKARLVMALLEPQAPDSLLAWGFFNNVFEKKEYMEPYVAEDVARNMLAADQTLKQAFDSKLKTDPKFAADPAARLEFFHRRHDSWDQNYQDYPVVRVDKNPIQKNSH